MGKETRALQRERRLDKEYAMALNRDYKAYRERYITSPNERKGPMLTKTQFATQFAKYYQQAKVSVDKQRSLRGHKIGEHIFEFESSAFSEKEFNNLTAAIKRARAEIDSRDYSFSGDAENIAVFMSQTNRVSENFIRANYTTMYSMLRGLFNTKEEYEEWISPEITAVSVI